MKKKFRGKQNDYRIRIILKIRKIKKKKINNNNNNNIARFILMGIFLKNKNDFLINLAFEWRK